MADHTVLGKIGHVSARIRPGSIGEVMIPVRGGTEGFYAKSREELAVGDIVVVVEHLPPRTVEVSSYYPSSSV